jgi:hypothetical protein
MASIYWNIKKGDLVKISPDALGMPASYGVVTSHAPYTHQISLFPVVMVFSFRSGLSHEYYPYNLEVVSSAA